MSRMLHARLQRNASFMQYLLPGSQGGPGIPCTVRSWLKDLCNQGEEIYLTFYKRASETD